MASCRCAGPPLDGLGRSLRGGVDRRLAEASARLEREGKLLESLGPHRVLERGYAIVRNLPDRKLAPTAAAAGGARELELEFADGRLVVTPQGARRGRGRGERDAGTAQETLL